MNKELFTFILALSLLGLPGNAAENLPKCDASTFIKDACNYFSNYKDQREIILSNGTKFPNPGWGVGGFDSPLVKTASASTSAALSNPDYEDLTLKSMDMTADFLLAFSKSIKSNKKIMDLPLRSQNVLLSASNLSLLFGTSTGGYGLNSYLYLPWPLNDPEAKSQKLNEEQIKQVKALFTKEQTSLVEEYSKKTTELYKTSSSNYVIQPSSLPTSTVSSERRDRLAELFKDAQEKLIRFIKQNKNENSLSAEQKALIQKVETVKYVPGNSSLATSNSICMSQSPNAFYFSERHSFTICDNIAMYPDAQIIMIMAHEMGHAIDPCRSQSDVYEVSEKLAHLGMNFTSGSDEARIQAELQNPEAKGSYLYANDLKWQVLDENAILKVIQTGELQKVQSGISPEDHPFENIRKCLVERLGFRNVDKKDIKLFISDSEDAAARSGKTLTKKDKVLLKKSISKSVQCYGLGSKGKHAETNEAMADVYGNAVLSQYLREHPPQNQSEKYGAIGFFLAYQCRNSDKYPQTQIEIIENLSQTIGNTKNLNHPYEKKRIESLALLFPGVAEGLGCSPPSKNICFDRLKVPLSDGVRNQSKTEKGTQ